MNVFPINSVELYFTVALLESVGAEQVLRDGSQGEAAAPTEVSGMECTRQLCDTDQKEEETGADEPVESTNDVTGRRSR